MQSSTRTKVYITVFLAALTITACQSIKDQARGLQVCIPQGNALAACIDEVEKNIAKPKP